MAFLDQSFAAVSAKSVAITRTLFMRRRAVHMGGAKGPSWLDRRAASEAGGPVAAVLEASLAPCVAVAAVSEVARGSRDLASRGLDGERPVDGLRRGILAGATPPTEVSLGADGHVPSASSTSRMPGADPQGHASCTSPLEAVFPGAPEQKPSQPPRYIGTSDLGSAPKWASDAACGPLEGSCGDGRLRTYHSRPPRLGERRTDDAARTQPAAHPLAMQLLPAPHARPASHPGPA